MPGAQLPTRQLKISTKFGQDNLRRSALRPRPSIAFSSLHTCVEFVRSFTRPWRNGDGMASVDQHALSCPPPATRSVHALANYLASPFPGQLQKARAILRWVAKEIIYDTDSLRPKKRKPQDPRTVLVSRLAVCQGFAELFSALACQAGLFAYVVEGFVKVPGAPPEKHAWNGLKIDGRLLLCDPTFAAGAVGSNGVFHQRFNSFYFDPPPLKLIQTHYPRDPVWQLIPKRIYLADFEARHGLKKGTLHF